MNKIIALLPLLVLAACAQSPPSHDLIPAQPRSSWPMYQYAPSHNAVFARPGFKVSWAYHLRDRINGGLAIVGDTLYVDSFDQYVYALNVATGKLRWKRKAENVLMSTPVVGKNVVIVGSGHNGFLKPDDWTSAVWGRPEGDDVLAFDSLTGTSRWRFHTYGEDMPSAAIIGDEAIFANGDLHAYALNLRTGKLLWQTALPGIVSMASITVDHGLAFVGACHDNPHRCGTLALDIRDGHIVWQSREGGSDASPTVENDLVFVAGDRDGSTRFRPGGRDVISALDERTGKSHWQYVGADGPVTIVASGEHTVAGTAVGGVLYQAVNTADQVVALDAASGNVRWRLRTTAPVKMSPIVREHRVYFGDTAGLLYTVDRATGSIIATSAMPKPFSTAPFVIVGKTLFAVNGSDVYAVPLSELEQD